MDTINSLPDGIPDFGYQFSYELWTPGTEIVLLNVPWFNDYRDIVQFETQGDFDRWINAQTHNSVTVSNLALIKPNQPIRLDIPFIDANNFNYMAVRSPETPAGSRAFTFYYFINSVNYVAPNTTEFIVQLDVWQSFGHKVKFGRCYVERGHVGIADSRSFDNFGKDVLTTPEPFDLGGEYGVVSDYTTPNSSGYSIMVISTTDLLADPGSINSPNLVTAKGRGFTDGVATGADVYFFDGFEDFSAFLSEVADKPWVTRGIISAYIIPPLHSNGVWQYNNSHIEPQIFIPATGANATLYVGFNSEPVEQVIMNNWRDELMSKLPYQYRHLKKFLTSPYCYVELTTYTGTPLMLKPELIQDNSLKLWRYVSLTMPNPRIVWWPAAYNAGHFRMGNVDEKELGEYLDVQTGIYNFPQIPVVNDSYMEYLASTTNTRSFMYDSASWTQERALAANQLSYNQASAGIDLSNQLTSLGITNRNQQMKLNNRLAILNGINPVIGGFAAGGVGGAALGALTSGISAGINIHNNIQSTQIANDLASATNTANVGNAGYVRDTNKSYADWAAQGDYANQIAGINAKIQDNKLLQPSTSGQFGGESFLLGMENTPWALHAKVKFINSAQMINIGDYWLRYGYAVNRFVSNMPDNLNVMSNFTYWRMKETYFESANCPELYKQTIRGIFEKGVTVWKNPESIGTTYIGDNDPIVKEYF